MSQKPNATSAAIGIDIGKNSFQIVGHDHRGAIVLRRKWSRRPIRSVENRTDLRKAKPPTANSHFDLAIR
ncbi:hypothetical protein AYJ54_31680 [Bradyrhizobium centrolobii]|uniref:Transposase n=1 Tax=Bradyrhizobium centrolobii TaxID=1505087 RepID=A0A176YAE5_9BRAD|nr:hypothetical protein AYJ54_31680 [Bradyrhizobium centrolobii]